MDNSSLFGSKKSLSINNTFRNSTILTEDVATSDTRNNNGKSSTKRMSLGGDFSQAGIVIVPNQTTLDSRREYLKNRKPKSNSIFLPDLHQDKLRIPEEN